MSKFGKRLIKAAKEARAIAQGNADPATYRVYVPADVDVRAIRHQLGISQQEFSARFGIELATLRDWEQGRRKPEGPARILMLVIKYDSAMVTKALAPKRQQQPAARDLLAHA